MGLFSLFDVSREILTDFLALLFVCLSKFGVGVYVSYKFAVRAGYICSHIFC